MDKQIKRKALILLAIGLLIIAASQVVSHYIVLPDFANGVLIGTGVGLLLIALIFGSFRMAK
ncbi:hypothetical protein O3Q51_08305 [Cryomorphaceae bacterium 1068]|nr:hypothetical protein [Cryomorphaceae bacterium 1068]